MADYGTADILSGEQKRAHIDTKTPFKSVRDAVSMFGEMISAKTKRTPKKRVFIGSKLNPAQELDKVILKLSDAEKARAKVSLELAEANRVLSELSKNREAPSPQLLSNNGDTCQYVVEATSQLDMAKQELEKLKEEIFASSNEKETAIEQAEKSRLAAKMLYKKLEELNKEIYVTNISLELVKAACEEANRELLSVRARDTVARDKLCFKLESLKGELKTAKLQERERKMEYMERRTNLEEAKLEFERTKQKQKLEKKDIKENTLRDEKESLERELSLIRKKMAQLREREANAIAAANALNLDLSRTKAELEMVVIAKTKAKGDLGLSQAFTDVATKADEAGIPFEAIRGEVRSARADSEEARLALGSIESRLQEALREADEAKKAEGLAWKRVQSLLPNGDGMKSLGSEIFVSTVEYDTLERKACQAMELANMRVAAAMAGAEAARESQMLILKRVKTVYEDIGKLKKTTKEALCRAEMAEAAKLAAESEMQNWWKDEESETLAPHCHLKIGDIDWSVPSAQASKETEIILNLISMKPPSEMDCSFQLKKDTSFLPHLGSDIRKRKNIRPKEER